MSDKKNKALRWRKIGDKAYELDGYVVLWTRLHDFPWTVDPVGGRFETLAGAKKAVKWYRSKKLEEVKS